MAIIETCTFQLSDSVDEADFLQADQDVQTRYFSPLKGFLRRTTARSGEGNWIVVTLWESEAAARAAAAATDAPAVAAFDRCIDRSHMTINRYTTLD